MSHQISPEFARRASRYPQLFDSVRAMLEGENASFQLGVLALAVTDGLATLESSGHVQAALVYLRELA